MRESWLQIALFLFSTWNSFAAGKIDRESIVRAFNPSRNASSSTTPLQVGNGNFAFGTDVTGLQTFLPYNTLSSWGWHNDSLPTTPGQTSPSDFTGLDWWTHGKLIPYDQPNPAERDISQWLIANPHRINLGRIGLWFANDFGNVTESFLKDKSQELDLWNGVISSRFTLHGVEVTVKTAVHPTTDAVGVEIQSELVKGGNLGVFFDYPYASGADKFDAPFVGVWNATKNHTTTLRETSEGAEIQHTLDATTYVTSVAWEDGQVSISGPLDGTHRYVLKTSQGSGHTINVTATFSPKPAAEPSSSFDVFNASSQWWSDYWESGAFISLPTSSSSAQELQRRIILSQYLMAVNSAGKDPPQESGLVNNGWYGKFHLEMVFWHLMHWTMWNKWEMLDRGSLSVYERFLATSIQRAQEQGYEGARFGKMSDPSGRSAPGEINSLLIWQQPHPMYFAEMEWRQSPTEDTLGKWDKVLTATADFMESYAFWNDSTGVYDLGPPMYPVSENTDPNQTVNPTFELAYWRFGLDVASKWQQRQSKPVPETWTHVSNNLAPLPIQDDVYVLYEGIEDMWTTPVLAEDHPALLGIQGWLPPDPSLNLTIFNNTIDKVYASWNFTYSYGWDFPLLAMTAARAGDPQRAVEWLLDPDFQFDDVGMPVGGTRVPTPYFPASSSMLLALGMMAGGWDGLEGPLFPNEWDVEVEGFARAM